MAFDLKKTLATIAKTGPNMQQAQKGGGDYEPPVAGACLLRFIGYIEIGKQESSYKGQVKVKDKVQLIFEVHGKNYPPKEIDGELYPHRIKITETLSLSEKANFYKLFNAMRNGREDITHMAQMLGEPFRGRIYHSEPSKDGRVYARLRNDAGYSIAPPYIEDAETGESRKVKVPEAISPLRLFVWDMASKEMWDSLFIDGEYEEGKTKNVFQEAIANAKNFPGSAIHQLLAGAYGDDDDDDTDGTNDVEGADGVEVDEEVTEAPKPTKSKKTKKTATTEDDDPLAGIGEDE